MWLLSQIFSCPCVDTQRKHQNFVIYAWTNQTGLGLQLPNFVQRVGFRGVAPGPNRLQQALLCNLWSPLNKKY